MARFEHHIFVCENSRPAGHPRGCCASKGSSEVRARLKALVKEGGLHGSVRANQAGCLDQCEKGVCLVVYPEGVWYGGVTVEDAEAILEAVVRGEVIERLQIPDSQLTGRQRRRSEHE